MMIKDMNNPNSLTLKTHKNTMVISLKLYASRKHTLNLIEHKLQMTAHKLHWNWPSLFRTDI
jgi:hypothetical protein